MTRRALVRTALCLAALLGASQAAANPISVDWFRARQVPGTQHVQVTAAVDPGFADQWGIESVHKDGVLLEVSWTDMSGYTANTGSGLMGLEASQFCDCDVSLGQHEYEVRLTSDDYPRNLSITVLAEVPPPLEPDVHTGELHPWEIPDPVGFQGLDCVATCASAGQPELIDAGGVPLPDAGHVPPPDTGATDTAGSTTDPGGGPTTTDDDDGGCDAGPWSAPPLVAVLMLLLFVAVRRRG